jgi:hypothetical protein
MVTSSHEAMHRIFQEGPGIFARTFARLGIPFTEPLAVSLLSTDLTEIKPLERRLDTLLQIDTADGESYLLAVEAQGRKDADKGGSWAYYLSYLYAKYRKQPILLVTCQDEETAHWAEGPFHFGISRWRSLTVRPLVLGPHNVPVITDPAAAARDIPLAVFSAITHGKHPQADTMLKALGSALKTVDELTASIFRELTELGLGTSPAAQIWKDLMAVDLSFFRSETSQQLRAEGRVEGRVEDLLLVIRTREIDLSDDLRARITGCTDLELLREWFGRALTAARAEDIFAPDEPGS